MALPEVRWAAVSLASFVVATGADVLGATGWIAGVLFAACYLAGGWEPAVAGLQALRHRTLDVDLLMVVAAVAAAAIGQERDGGLLVVIFATSGALEAVATKRTQDSVRALLEFAPETATRLTPTGHEEIVDTAALEIGDVILVRPGERIGADGRVVDGVSEVDEATITGEALPVVKRGGADVYAGTMNGRGALEVVVERAASDTVMARIATLVDEASATKARRQLFIEKVEQRYSAAVVIATVSLIAVPVVFGAEFRPTLLRAMTFMIVASPCAVVLATMPPLLSAVANAGRHGVLVKSALVMEQLADTAVVAMDKTGTLTAGLPTVTTVMPFADRTVDEVLAAAAAVEARSEHPLGRAIVAAARRRNLAISDVGGFFAAPGRGVTAEVDGHQVTVGSPAMSDSDTADAAVRDAVARIEGEAETPLVVSVDGRPAGVIALADEVRAEAAAAMAAIASSTGRSPVMLTGDNRHVAHAVARRVAISEVHAELLPEDKVARVRMLRERGPVTVVGDGVNDAPMLASAETGIAMGRTGSDLALDTADVLLVRDDLATVPAMIEMSRRARRVIVQNLVFAAGVIVALVAWDLLGHLPLPLGVAGHEMSTVIVGLNGLRLLSSRAWPSTEPG